HAELVGETHARYYNVAQRRYRELPNTRHASLCATALRGDAVETLRQVCRNHARYIDMELWRQHPGSLFQGGRVTGIKGLPGRGGIGIGHRQRMRGEADPSGTVLRRWIGE